MNNLQTTKEQYEAFLKFKMLPMLNAWMSRPELMQAWSGFDECRYNIKELIGHD